MSALIFFPMSLCDYTFYICDLTVFFLFPTFCSLVLSSLRDFILLLFGLSLNHHHLLLPLCSIAVRIFSSKGKSAKCLFPDVIALIGGPGLCLGKRYITKGAVCASPSGLHWGWKKDVNWEYRTCQTSSGEGLTQLWGQTVLQTSKFHGSSRKRLYFAFNHGFPSLFSSACSYEMLGWGFASLRVMEMQNDPTPQVPLCHIQTPKGQKGIRARSCCLFSDALTTDSTCRTPRGRTSSAGRGKREGKGEKRRRGCEGGYCSPFPCCFCRDHTL